MKGILNLLITGVFVIATSTAIAATDTKTTENKTKETKTQTDGKWICTTNASSSDVAEDKNADTKMEKTGQKGNGAFEFALKHCRDCNKITCELQTE